MKEFFYHQAQKFHTIILNILDIWVKYQRMRPLTIADYWSLIF